MLPKILRIRFFAVPDTFRGALPPVLFALVAMEEIRLFQSVPRPIVTARGQKHAVRLREKTHGCDANRLRTWHTLPGAQPQHSDPSRIWGPPPPSCCRSPRMNQHCSKRAEAAL